MSVPPAVTLAEYAETFLARETHRLKRLTLERYSANLRQHLVPALGRDTPLAALTRTQIRAVLQTKLTAGYMGGTVGLMLTVLRVVLNAAVDDELLAANPAAGLKRLIPRRRGPRAQTALSREDLHRLLVAAPQAHSALDALFVVGARTGMRIGELLGLRWDDVDPTRRTVCVARTVDWRGIAGTPKGGELAVLPLSHDAAAALAALRAADVGPSPWIFHGPSGRPWRRTYVRLIMDRACRVAGIRRVTPHALRHSFCTHLAEDGVSPWRLRDLARHRSITTTELYLHLVGDGHAEVDGLDRRRRRRRR